MKSLPPRLFYDAPGSALFEAITRLPEYYLTRTELSILEAHANDILSQAGPDLTLIELGAGSATKTRVILSALLKRQERVTYYAVDVSASALDAATRNLERTFPRLVVRPIVSRYRSALEHLGSIDGRKLVLFLGSSIGNYDPDHASSLLRDVRGALAPADALVLGADLRKDAARLIPAYDDAAGVTARFNKNLLSRINRELGGHFDLDRFRHIALWSPEASRMEMYLESTHDQQIPIDALGMTVELRAGERIHTENSYKFTELAVESILRAGEFMPERAWFDERRWFGVYLARVA